MLGLVVAGSRSVPASEATRNGTVEQRGVERPHDVEVRPLILVAADPRLGQLRQARGQVDLGVRIVGLPADAGRLGAHAAIRQPADDEGRIGHLRRRADAWRSCLRGSSAGRAPRRRPRPAWHDERGGDDGAVPAHVRRLTLFEQAGNLRLDDLAHRVARQRGHGLQGARDFVGRELDLRPLLQLVERQRRAACAARRRPTRARPSPRRSRRRPRIRRSPDACAGPLRFPAPTP